jgi:hypothetical protein
MSLSSVPPFRGRRSSRRISKPAVANALSVRTGSVRGGSFFSSTRIAAWCLRSAARSLRWRSTAAESVIPPAC